VVAVLPLGQALEELLAIASNELSCQFDCIHVNVGQGSRVALGELELISWRRLCLILSCHEISFAGVCGVALENGIVGSMRSKDLLS